MISLSSYALMFIGTPYVWNGNTPEQGFDCSGLVNEVLMAHGHLPKKDRNAQGIYDDLFPNALGSAIKKDTILFFGKDVGSITHIAIAISEILMVEAGGEGQIASKEGFVRIRPISNRGDLVASLIIQE